MSGQKCHLASQSNEIDATLTQVSSDGALTFSTFLGETDPDWGLAVAADPLGRAVYLAGATFSSNFSPAPASNVVQPDLAGVENAFAAQSSHRRSVVPVARVCAQSNRMRSEWNLHLENLARGRTHPRSHADSDSDGDADADPNSDSDANPQYLEPDVGEYHGHG